MNVLPSCGRTNLGRAVQLGHLPIVCLLLDAEKFYSTPEEEDIDNDIMFNSPSSEPVTNASPHPIDQLSAAASSTILPYSNAAVPLPPPTHTPQHKCCSPSIDSETCTCSDEVCIIH